MSVRLLIVATVLVAVSSLVARAQLPALRYTFTKGRTLVYRQVFDQTDEQNHGQFKDSFVHTTVLRVFVENVDSAGNGTLLCDVIEQGYRKKNTGESTPELTRTDSTRFGHVIISNPTEEIPTEQSVKLTSTRPDIPPKYRVTISPRGEYLSGEILVKSESDKQMEEMKTTPNVIIRSEGQYDQLKEEIGDFFHLHPEIKATRFGETWADTTNRKEKISVYGAKSYDEPRYQFTVERRDHVVLEAVGPDSSRCLVLEEHLWKAQRISNDTKEHRWSSQEKYYLRPDGVCLGKDILTTSKSVSLDDGEKDAPLRGKAKFIISIRLLREE